MGMQRRSWISHYIIPCTGNSSCKHCKPGEQQTQQHVFSKRVTEVESSSPQNDDSWKTMSINSLMPITTENELSLRRRKLLGSFFGNLEPIPFDPEIDPETFTCYNCWSDEHLSKECPEPKVNKYCCNCGRWNVQVDDCPRCAKAYREFIKDWNRKTQEKCQLSEVLCTPKKILREEDLCTICSTKSKDRLCEIHSSREMDTLRGKRLKDDWRGFEYSSAKFKSDKMHVHENERYWTDSDEDVYQSVQASSPEGNRIATSTAEEEYHSFSDHYESAQASFVRWSEAGVTLAVVEEDEEQFCSGVDEDDYESTRAAFFREFDSVNLDGFDEDCNDISSSSGLSDECSSFSESFRSTLDAHSNELFVYIRNKKIEAEFAYDNVNRELLATPGKSKSEYYVYEEEDNEDYDCMIVDENERSESLSSDDYAIREFLDLLDALKHLPIHIQNIAVLHFVSERKKQYGQS